LYYLSCIKVVHFVLQGTTSVGITANYIPYPK